MPNKSSVPSERTHDQLKNHYLTEKSIAERLKNADREERKKIYATMYDELFRKIPDHSRLSRRSSIEKTAKANRSKFSMVRGLLNPDIIFAEFAPGDCKFDLLIADQVKNIIAIDISDQRDPEDIFPDNFKLIVYDGFDLKEILPSSVDIVFSDQFIEHLHPDDAEHHFEVVNAMLKKGGKYVFRTPHAMSGPHDISRYFSEEPEGFHLKEWTYLEIYPVLRRAGFSKMISKRVFRGWLLPVPFVYIVVCEKFFRLFPRSTIRNIFNFLISGIQIVATK